MHRVIWYQFRAKRRCDNSYAMVYVPLPNSNGALLLRQILSMPRDGKTKMDFTTAMNWCIKGLHDRFEDPNETRETCAEYLRKMIQMLSDQGYWIELTGQEFCVVDEKAVGYA